MISQPNKQKIKTEGSRPVKIVIAGGGGAGVFAAAALILYCDNVEIVMLHDPDTPYIGVGESLGFTTRRFMRDYLHFAQDDEWVPKTNSTHKLGVVHTGFDGTSNPHYSGYFFQPSANILDQSIVSAYQRTLAPKTGLPPTGELNDQYSLVDIWLHLHARGLRKSETLESDLGEMYWYMRYGTMPDMGNQNHMVRISSSSFHMNADYAKDFIFDRLCAPNNVCVVPKKIKHIKVNEHGITALVCDDDTEVSGDLYIDCTGFKRILAKQLPFKWIALPEEFSDSAIVGQGALPRLNHGGLSVASTNTTEHHAMQHGWAFSLPMPDRSGNGYVFNSRLHDNEDELANESDQKFPWKAGCLKRKIKWEPGYYEKFFVQNCIVLGISGGFTDPYDANGFTTVLRYIEQIVQYVQDDTARTFEWQDLFNKFGSDLIQDVQLRIQTGLWCCTKDDSEYWHAMHRAAKRDNLLEKWREAMFDPRRKYPNKSHVYGWSQGVHVNQAMYYGIDIKPPLLPISATTEQLAINFFDFFNRSNQLHAQQAQSVRSFYENLQDYYVK
jgi:hypothetical protein